jgi:hypothetical protein
MLRELFSSRLILAGLVILFVVAGACWFYSWHVQRTVDAELAKTDAMLHSPKNDGETRYAQDTVDTILVDSDDTQMSDDTAVSSVDNASEMLDTADASLPEEAPAEDVPVSPFGFGPYPEVPAGYYGTPSWLWSEEYKAKLEKALSYGLKARGISFTDHLKISELQARVGIKLFNEGVNFSGMTSLDQNGLFYPDEPNVIYVAWEEVTEKNGEVRHYISASLGSAISELSIAEQMGYEPIPDWIEVRSYADGIDPYEYLGLNR